ncbi:MAG: single-stranded-DNA-specific exonuclease RecJ, partial [Clostridia bacterium]|nr:single-stranded-DNA-specific exonuclease RecJ [Clostridia bacterium]
EEIRYAYERGMQVVVTDHHKVGDELPECEAVVDPQRPDCTCPFKEMAGVGVAFKLACAIDGEDADAVLDEFGEFVAMGTIGDVVSLTGENRVMVKRGIAAINEHPSPGVAALLKAAGAGNKRVSSSTVAYMLCPRINAAGRMGSASKALELLLSDDSETAEFLADEINSMNTGRQTCENELFRKALAIMQDNPEIGNSRIIVVDGEDWHQGVIGIVAAKLTERFGRPSVVISRSGSEAKGSCRSIPGFSVYEAIDAVSGLLTHYGGHTLAAGIGLRPEDIDVFRKRINEYAADKEMPFAEQRIDCRIQPASVSLQILSSLECIEPFGADNPQPYFGLFGVTIDDYNGVAEGAKHLRLNISKNGSQATAMFFNMPPSRFPFEKGDTVDLAVNLEKNVYNGELRVSTVIRSIRPSDTDEEKVLGAIALYDRFARGEEITAQQALDIIPGREILAGVYKSIKAKPLKDKYCEALCVRFGDDGSNLAKYTAAVDIMLEAGVLEADEDNRVYAPNYSGKANLEETPIMKKLLEISRV